MVDCSVPEFQNPQLRAKERVRKKQKKTKNPKCVKHDIATEPVNENQRKKKIQIQRVIQSIIANATVATS